MQTCYPMLHRLSRHTRHSDPVIWRSCQRKTPLTLVVKSECAVSSGAIRAHWLWSARVLLWKEDALCCRVFYLNIEVKTDAQNFCKQLWRGLFHCTDTLCLKQHEESCRPRPKQPPWWRLNTSSRPNSEDAFQKTKGTGCHRSSPVAAWTLYQCWGPDCSDTGLIPACQILCCILSSLSTLNSPSLSPAVTNNKAENAQNQP